MSPSIAELLPAIAALSPADKFRLVQLVLAQLEQANNDGVELTQPPSAPFNPRSFFGVTHQPRQVIDDYLASTREGWR
jgi:hypothetical protein